LFRINSFNVTNLNAVCEREIGFLFLWLDLATDAGRNFCFEGDEPDLVNQDPVYEEIIR